MPNTHEEGTRGTVICVVMGLLAAALGGMIRVAAEGQEPATALATFLLVLGIPLFFIALIVEFFNIGANVRNVARSSQAALSLLKDVHAITHASGRPADPANPPATDAKHAA